MPLNYTVKMANILNFMLWIFYHNKIKSWSSGELKFSVNVGTTQEVVYNNREGGDPES